VAGALEKTLNFLACTPNQAAVPVLFSALDSSQAAVRLGAIRALIDRRNAAGHRRILERYSNFGEPEHAVVAESLHHSTHHMKPALAEAVEDEDLDLCESACHVVLLGRVYELLPTLVKVAENQRHRHSAQAAATLVQLAQLLHQELTGEAHERTCDPFFVRRQMLPSFEKAIANYHHHNRLEIVAAFLLIVPPGNKTLLDVLTDVAHPCHHPVMESFGTSAVNSVLQLLAEMLHDTTAPRPVLEIVAQRRDRKFLDYLLHHVGTPVSLRVQENMRRLFAVPWLEDSREVLAELDGPAQAAAVELAVASGIDRAHLFDLLRFLLRRGRPEGRRASCEALSRFHDRDADECIVEALQDSDPRVQAAAVRQIRRRHVPNSMERLVGFLDHPAPEVRDAARSSLAEFNFMRYESAFESFDEQVRKITGRLVRKVDRSATHRLIVLLTSPSPSTRFRGLEMVVAMEHADAVLPQLIALSTDRDLDVRTEAMTALGLCSAEEALEALERAEQDPNPSVRDAAAAAIEVFMDRLATTQGQSSGVSRGIH
jgi:HEAT repeat protein